MFSVRFGNGAQYRIVTPDICVSINLREKKTFTVRVAFRGIRLTLVLTREPLPRDNAPHATQG